MQYEYHMIDVVNYLHEGLQVEVVERSWPGEAKLPLHLRDVANYSLCVLGRWESESVEDGSFVLARMKEGATLPECKRVHRVVSSICGLPTVICAPLESRQRQALASQGLPFITPGLQIHMPFLGMTLSSRAPAGLRVGRQYREKLSARAQTAAVWAARSERWVSLFDMRQASGLHASDASRAVEELVDQGIADKTREGRMVQYSIIGGRHRMLDEKLSVFDTPVLKTIMVRSDPSFEVFPLGGESALAERTDLTPPRVTIRAVSHRDARALTFIEAFEGEYPDEQTTLLQIWKTPPLFGDSADRQIDDVSLGLSLSAGDERIEQALEQLFGKEYLWPCMTASA